MNSGSTRNKLKRAVEEFSKEVETIDDIKVMAIKIDVFVSEILRTPFAESQLGKAKVDDLSAREPYAPHVLRQFSSETFQTAAAEAEELVLVAQSSILDAAHEETEILDHMESVRSQLHQALSAILAEIGESRTSSRRQAKSPRTPKK